MKFVKRTPRYDSLKNVDGIKKFFQQGQHEFFQFMINFLNVEEVRLQSCKLEELKAWLRCKEISNLMDVPDRDDEICVVSQIFVNNELICYFPYVLKGRDVKSFLHIKSFIPKLAEAVSDQISLSYLLAFNGGDWIFGENLARLIVSNCISANTYDGMKYAHLIEKVEQLASSTFEGDFFPTGAIVSYDTSKYKDGFFEFIEKRELDEINKREWLLANGRETFYLLDSNTVSRGIYRRKADSSSDFIGRYFDGFFLNKKLNAPDFIIRAVGPNEISISDSDGKEFVKIENVWRYRHSKRFTKFLTDMLDVDYKLSYAILYYTIWCSRNHISSIIWIPRDASDEAISELTTPNRVKIWKSQLSILDESHQVLIEKILASDGAIVIDKKGDVQYESVFADMSKSHISKAKLTGSGETATRLLAQNGVAVKISQDGSIKIFSGTEKICY